MAGKTLILTGLKESWPDNLDGPVLFLGPWCCHRGNKQLWCKLGGEIEAYHWDNPQKLKEDIPLLARLREEALFHLARALNRFHRTNYSVRFWRILIGPWLNYFVPILYDRWFTLCLAFQRHQIKEVTITEPSGDPAADTTSHFESQIYTDRWNEELFGEMLTFGRKEFPCTLRRVHMKNQLSQLNRSCRVVRFFGRCLNALANSHRHFIYKSYLPHLKEAQLQIWLRQIPCPELGVPMPNRAAGLEWLGPLDGWEGSPQAFERILTVFLPRYLPKIFLGGFLCAIRKLQHTGLPGEPQSVFTSNAWCSDDIFKIWCGLQIEKGVPLIIGQHGGNDGTSLFNTMEDHQFAIADRVVTWGWLGEGESAAKSRPAFNLKRLRRAWRPSHGGDALLVGVSVPQYFYQLYSMPIGTQWLEYFDGQCSFVEGLNPGIQKRILVRLYQPDYGWRQKERWREKFPEVRIDDGHSRIDKLVRRSRLYISTYNATTFLESLHDNFPSLIFWNPKHFELRASAKPFFRALEAAGIFHSNPKSAAQHLNTHWDHLEDWWRSDQVQESRQKFCHQYSRQSQRPLALLREILEESSLTILPN